MDLKDILTLVFAGLGAILSTVPAARELFREKRNIKIILFRVHWSETYKIAITNAGHRPVTIREVGLGLGPKGRGGKGAELVPASSCFTLTSEGRPPHLPVILTDSQTVEFYLSEHLCQQLNNASWGNPQGNEEIELFIFVYDAEGNLYSKYKRAQHDIKNARMTRK